MSTVLGGHDVAGARARWVPWLAVVFGLAALYVPSYLSFAHTVWRDDEYAHGPIVLAVAAWLFWRERAALLEDRRGSPALGATVLVPGLVLYIAGRAFGLPLFEAASHIPVIAGLVLAIGGTRALRRLAFPIALLAFAIPLPGFVLDAITTPLKTVVSIAVAAILGAAGYPIERSGVVLGIGDHQMMVADACSGLNSMYGLLALALLYAHLTPPRTLSRMAILLAAIVPIAVIANIVRVTALVLLSYHAGEDAAQGFLHGLAGLLVFVIALGMLIAFDSRLRHGTNAGAAETQAPTHGRSRLGAAPYVVALAMVGAAAATPMLKPVPADSPIDLERVLPASFGDWRIDPEVIPVSPAPDVQARLDLIYSQVLSRTYVNSRGERMMLTVAHGGDQSDALKAHRQEKCYEAQGFEISGLRHEPLAIGERSIPATRMVAVRGDRVEPVTYWFTMGDRVVLGRFERLRAQVAAGMRGRIPDGMLVRISNLSGDSAQSFAAQQAFAAAIFAQVSPQDATRFIGAREG